MTPPVNRRLFRLVTDTSNDSSNVETAVMVVGGWSSENRPMNLARTPRAFAADGPGMQKHSVVKRRGITALVGALVLPLALSACGGDSTSDNKTAGGAQTSKPAGSAGAPASEAPLADPCTLSTTEIVSSTFSVKANGPNPPRTPSAAQNAHGRGWTPSRAPAPWSSPPRTAQVF